MGPDRLKRQSHCQPLFPQYSLVKRSQWCHPALLFRVILGIMNAKELWSLKINHTASPVNVAVQAPKVGNRFSDMFAMHSDSLWSLFFFLGPLISPSHTRSHQRQVCMCFIIHMVFRLVSPTQKSSPRKYKILKRRRKAFSTKYPFKKNVFVV